MTGVGEGGLGLEDVVCKMKALHVKVLIPFLNGTDNASCNCFSVIL